MYVDVVEVLKVTVVTTAAPAAPATGARGYDLMDAPASITTRVLLNSGKTQVLAQAVQVTNK